jgi:protein-S-isoprenylcysteine O-methyltransferase Ste14
MNRVARPLFLNLGLSALVILLADSAFMLDRTLGINLPAGFSWLGWPMIVAGSGIILWSVISLLRYSEATGAPGDPTKKLVRSGPYLKVRNPIYAADGVLLIGLAFLTGSVVLIGYDILYLLAIDFYVRRFEEPGLEKRFGQDYQAYKTSVPRWLPRLSSGQS